MTEPTTSMRKDGSATVDARNWSWPPFEEGNVAALRHGANSKRILTPLVEAIIDWLHAVAPWTSAPVFAPAVHRYAWAEAEAHLRREAFDAVGPAGDADNDGTERRHRAEDRAERLARSLGLDPLALTKLLGNLNSIDAPAAQAGLDALREQGAAIAKAASKRAIGAGS